MFFFGAWNKWYSPDLGVIVKNEVGSRGRKQPRKMSGHEVEHSSSSWSTRQLLFHLIY